MITWRAIIWASDDIYVTSFTSLSQWHIDIYLYKSFSYTADRDLTWWLTVVVRLHNLLCRTKACIYKWRSPGGNFTNFSATVIANILYIPWCLKNSIICASSFEDVSEAKQIIRNTYLQGIQHGRIKLIEFQNKVKTLLFKVKLYTYITKRKM